MAYRDISSFLQAFRNFLAGRQLVSRHRFQDMISCRTQPPPNLPPGPNDRLFKNPYYTRNPKAFRYSDVTIFDSDVVAALEANKLEAEEEGKKLESTEEAYPKKEDIPKECISDSIPNVHSSDADASQSAESMKSGESAKSTTSQGSPVSPPGNVHRWD